MLYNANQEEKEILNWWEKHAVFERSVSERPDDKPYVFYDGPPFATGLPHYGHILSSVIKDVVPRYFTMKGYRVPRRWGWDCHGLPIESLVEKELQITGGKKQIEEELGVEKFNEACRSKVLTYTKDWKTMVDRIGRWVEFDNAYKTMDATYMESVWWALKTIWDKQLIYEGRKVLMYCPRCETPVSKAEIAMDNSYKDVTEESATVKFKLKEQGTRNKEQFKDINGPIFVLAWTTTPWTLPGNVALAVGAEIEYVLLKEQGAVNKERPAQESSAYYVVAKERLGVVFKDKSYEIVKEFKGSDLAGLEYEPLFNLSAVSATGKKAHYIAAADFVTTTDGTGVVHTAVIYGEDDYQLGVKLDLPMVPMLDAKGHFNEAAPELVRGEYFKKAEKLIKNNLEERGLLFKREQFTHSYPHCWRCDTALIYNAISAWFIDIQKIKPRLLALNEKINWYPEHLKHGRFLNILETAPDWNISRNRYWATPLPFWKCSEGKRKNEKGESVPCTNVVCVGSVADLKAKALNFAEVFSSDKVEEIDLHKHVVDKIKLKCDACGGAMERIPEVIDCWVESGSMPFAEWHYPFENKEVFQQRFPGQYIAEYIAQTRAWFYYMHVMAVLLFDNVSFENCVTTGNVLNEKGEKLSKSKKNYPDPWGLIETHGVDALRFYLMTSPVMQADDLFFSDREVKEAYNKVLNLLWNVVEFYLLYAGEYDGTTQMHHSTNLLDKWIVAKANLLVKEVTEHMDHYDTVKAGRPIKDFVDELSTWYLRRSRERLKGEDQQGKQHALATLHHVLLVLAKVMAPFTPFMAEKIYQELRNKEQGTRSVFKESVHLEDWPHFHEEHHHEKVLEEMIAVRKIVEMGLALRAEHKLKVRQPLSELRINNDHLPHELLNIVAEELNVKKVEYAEFVEGDEWKEKKDGAVCVWLNTLLDDTLKVEGVLREIIRAINQLRKEQGLTIHDRVEVWYAVAGSRLADIFQTHAAEIQAATLANELAATTLSTETAKVKIEFEGESAEIAIYKKETNI